MCLGLALGVMSLYSFLHLDEWLGSCLVWQRLRVLTKVHVLPEGLLDYISQPPLHLGVAVGLNIRW